MEQGTTPLQLNSIVNLLSINEHTRLMVIIATCYKGESHIPDVRHNVCLRHIHCT